MRSPTWRSWARSPPRWSASTSASGCSCSRWWSPPGWPSLGRRGQADDAVIGTVFAWVLGIGVLLLAVLATSSAGGYRDRRRQRAVRLDLLAHPGRLAPGRRDRLAVALTVLFAVRPLITSTLDAELASVRGVPVRALAIGFLAVLAVVTAESTQAVGALLLLGLLAAPAGAAHQLTANPYQGNRAVRAARRAGHVGRPRAELPGRLAAAEQRDHRPGRRGLRRRHAADPIPSPADRITRDGAGPAGGPGGSQEPGPPPVPSCGIGGVRPHSRRGARFVAGASLRRGPSARRKPALRMSSPEPAAARAGDPAAGSVAAGSDHSDASRRRRIRRRYRGRDARVTRGTPPARRHADLHAHAPALVLVPVPDPLGRGGARRLWQARLAAWNLALFRMFAGNIGPLPEKFGLGRL